MSAQHNERLDLSKKYLQVCGVIIFPIALVSVALCIIKPEYVVAFDLVALILILLICIKIAMDYIRAY